jgi:hypothetical protein
LQSSAPRLGKDKLFPVNSELRITIAANAAKEIPACVFL